MALPHVLLAVDDDKDTTKVWSELAAHFGWHTLAANSLEEFREHLKNVSPSVALIDLALTEDRTNRDGLTAFDAAVQNGTTYCAVASNFIEFDDARKILHNRGAGVFAHRKKEINSAVTFAELLADGYAWSMAARAPLMGRGVDGQHFRAHIAEAICGTQGVGLLTQHTGLMGALILDTLADVLGDLAPFCAPRGGPNLEQGDGFVHTELWSTTRAGPIWLGITSVPGDLSAEDAPSRFVQVSRAMRQHLEREGGYKATAIASAFRLVEQDGLLFGMIGTKTSRTSFSDFSVPYWMRRREASQLTSR